MFVAAGFNVDVFCLNCNRVWTFRACRDHENTKEFDDTNKSMCPWCGFDKNVARRPDTKAKAVNGFAFAFP